MQEDDEQDHYTSLITLVGQNKKNLHMLATLSPKITEPESIWSVILKFEMTLPKPQSPQYRWSQEVMLPTWMTSMDESPSGQLYAVSTTGELHTKNGNKWSMQKLKCPKGLNRLWVASDEVLFAVGPSGCRVKVEKGQPEVSLDSKGRRLSGVHGTSPDNVYVVGEEGCIFRYHRGEWSEIESPTNVALVAVHCQGKDVYVAGGQGTLFRLTNNSWEEFHGSDEITFTSLAWFKNALYAAGGDAGTYRLGPDGLEQCNKQTINRLKAIDDMLFGFGNNLLIHYDGSDWLGSKLDF